MPPKSKKKPMDSKFEFWNELSDKMRMECIKKMDFKTRMQLRATSKQDKLLVESAPKYQFDSVEVDLDVVLSPKINCKKSNNSEVRMVRRAPFTAETTNIALKKAYQLAIQIVKFSNADHFKFRMTINKSNFLSKMTYLNWPMDFISATAASAPFHFKSVTLDCVIFEMAQFFLLNCDSLESIELESIGHGFEQVKIKHLIHFPAIINVKNLRMLHVKEPDVPYQLIKKWLEQEDLELGKTLQVMVHANFLIKFLAEKFGNCVVSKTRQTLRLRSNSIAKKHIFIKKVPNEDFSYSAVVIPSDKEESEIESDDQWMMDFHANQKRQFVGGILSTFDAFKFADLAAQLGDRAMFLDQFL